MAYVDPAAALRFLNFSAGVFTIGQFMTGVQTCYLFRLKGNTADMSSLPFVAGALNCAVWSTYGALIGQAPMQVRI